MLRRFCVFKNSHWHDASFRDKKPAVTGGLRIQLSIPQPLVIHVRDSGILFACPGKRWPGRSPAMSTASRNCGTACGTCGGGRNAASIPGAEGRTRGYYDPRAERQFGHLHRTRWKAPNERLPRATNAAPPRKRVQGQANRPRMSRGPRASLFFPIGLREPRLRHSPPSSFARPPPAVPAPCISARASASQGARMPAAAAKRHAQQKSPPFSAGS